MTEICYNQHSDSSTEESLIGNSEGIDLLKGNWWLGQESADIQKILNNMVIWPRILQNEMRWSWLATGGMKPITGGLNTWSFCLLGPMIFARGFWSMKDCGILTMNPKPIGIYWREGTSSHMSQTHSWTRIFMSMVSLKILTPAILYNIYSANPKQVVSLCKFCFPQEERYHAHKS